MCQHIRTTCIKSYMCTCGKLLTLSPFFFFVPKPHFNTWQIYSGGCCVFISGTDTECTYCKSLLCPYFSTLCTLRIKWRGGHLLTSVEPPVYVLNTELWPPGISQTTSLHFPAEARCSTTWRVSEISETLSMVFFLRIFWSTPTEFWQYVLRDWSIQYLLCRIVRAGGRPVVRAQAAQARGPGFNSWWLPALHFLLLLLKINNPLYTSYIPASKGSPQIHASMFCLATWCYMISPCLCDGSPYLHSESGQILEMERPRVKVILFFYPVAKVCCVGNLGILNCWQCMI